MDENWLTINRILSQEKEVELKTQQRFGKNRDGFCDYALTGIELLIQGVMYLRNVDELNENGSYKNFNYAIRSLAYLQIQRVSYSFKSTYNLLLQGYYTESAIILRSIIETLVRMRYIYQTGKIENVKKVFSWGKPRKEGFNVQYKEMFETISNELNKMYQLLCDISHGGIGSHVFRIDPKPEAFQLDTGIVYREMPAAAILNQYMAYLLAHIEMMGKIFPEMFDKMPASYSAKYHKTLQILWTYMEQVSNDKSSEFWYKAIKDLIRFN
jgi:hypothetical protein